MTAGVVTLGETMALLTAPSGRHLRGGTQLPIGIGGAESNVAIGLARLDVPVTWVSRVGNDAFGAMVTREIRAEGVHVAAAVDTDAPTGLMVKEHLHGTPVRVRYYRAGSAASRLSPTDLDAAPIADARVLHLTGITAALSPTALETVREAIRIARAAGTLVSFDVNHRVALWSAERAAEVLRELCGQADLVFAGVSEAELVLGTPPGSAGEDALAAGLADLGPATVVLKLGAEGALISQGIGAANKRERISGRKVQLVDATGAGDCFCGNLLAQLAKGTPVVEAARYANTAASIAVQGFGAVAPLPRQAEVEALL